MATAFAARAVAAVAASVATTTGVEVRESTGCSGVQSHSWGEDGFLRYQIDVTDFEPVQREFWVQAPGSSPGGAGGWTKSASSFPAPVLLSFHGQHGDAKDNALKHNFSTVGGPSGLLSVYPQGLEDATPDQDQGTGWNVGSAGAHGNETCVPDGVGDHGGCYNSCQKLGMCGRCNWSTCYNDVLFIKQVLYKLASDFCVDLNRIYLQGVSNGGMFVNHLVREMPDTFAGVVPCFGSPMLGFLLGSEMQLVRQQAAIAKTALLTLHARSDEVIPSGGGVSNEGWIYESETSVRGSWAALHGCQEESSEITTPWDGGDLHIVCREHLACQSGRRVVGCRYDGAHGDWPAFAADEIVIWFLLQFSRGQPVNEGTQLFV